MAQITITIPDAAIPRINDAFAAEFSYRATLPDGTPNPQTKGQFTKERVIAYIKAIVTHYEGSAAAQASRDQKESEIQGISMT